MRRTNIILLLLIVTKSCFCEVIGAVSDGDDEAEEITADRALVDVTRCLIWGPGLKAEFSVPARYFFFQAVDYNGNNITLSLGEKPISVEARMKNGEHVRIHMQVLDRHDGSYIVRYKVYSNVPSMLVDVTFNGRHVADSPYVLDAPVYTEQCHCPQPSFPRWLSTMECPTDGYPQITKDLAPFPRINMSEVASDAVARFNKRGSHSLCHYVVKDNKIYRKTYGQHVGFKMFTDAILLSLTNKVVLPDIEFFVNLGDWPLVKRDKKDRSSPNPLPILSWCGSSDTYDIVMPTYDITDSTLETMGRCASESQTLEMPTFQVTEEVLKSQCRVSLDMLSVQANTGPPWRRKAATAFWRGRDSRQERLDLVRMSLDRPAVIDARLTNMFFFKHDVTQHGEIVKHVSFFSFFEHKYQVSLDGTVAAYRLPYLLAGDSVILKQESSYYEHFYNELQPYVHYVPIKRDLSDLLTQIQWLKDNDDKAQAIGKAAQQYVRENLMAGDIFCYHAILFQEYAKRLVAPPVVLPDMELVEADTKDKRFTKCLCHHDPQKKEEL